MQRNRFKYTVLFNNPIDRQQLANLARRIYPSTSTIIMKRFEKATSHPYGYLVIDLKSDTPEKANYIPKYLIWQNQLTRKWVQTRKALMQMILEKRKRRRRKGGLRKRRRSEEEEVEEEEEMEEDNTSVTNKNIIMSSFKISRDIQKKEGGPDSCFG